MIGFLDSRSSDGMTSRLASFRQGLKEVGLVEGENVTIIYRWAEDRVDRLPEMASELAQQATVIVTTGGPPAAFAAKAASTTIPIVFLVGEDPARLGLVTSLARPGGNRAARNCRLGFIGGRSRRSERCVSRSSACRRMARGCGACVMT